MRVRAIKMGFMPGPVMQRVRVGVELDLPDDTEGDWFVRIDADGGVLGAEEAPTRRQRRRAETLSEVAKAPVEVAIDELTGRPIFSSGGETVTAPTEHDPIA